VVPAGGGVYSAAGNACTSQGAAGVLLAGWNFDGGSTASTSGLVAGTASSGRATAFVTTPGYYFSGTKGWQASGLSNGAAFDYLRFCASTASYTGVGISLALVASVALPASQLTLAWSTSGGASNTPFGALAAATWLTTSPAVLAGSPSGDNAPGFCVQVATTPAAPPGPLTLGVDDVQILATGCVAGYWNKGDGLCSVCTLGYSCAGGLIVGAAFPARFLGVCAAVCAPGCSLPAGVLCAGGQCAGGAVVAPPAGV
jgi:hypothetical protein